MSEILRFEGVSRRFHGVHALSGVSFAVEAGEIHAIVGANGAGKSTLMKLLVGIHQPDAGRIFLLGEPVHLSNPRAAAAMGIDIVFQEIELAPNLNVAESLFLGREPARGGVLRYAEAIRRTGEILNRLRLPFGPLQSIESLSVAEKQLVQICRALAADARVIIMDEPTSSLTDLEADRLFDILAGLRDEGRTILYISHKMEEIFRLADTITVLRDGRHVETAPAAGMTRDRLLSLMIGTARDAAPTEPTSVGGAPVLEIENLTAGGRFENVSLTLRAGQVLGLFGIVGAGRTEVARCLFALDRWDSGEIRLVGKSVRFRSAADAVAAGLALVPEDRKLQGLLLEQSLLQNITLSSLRGLSRMGVVVPRQEFAIAKRYVEALGVVASGPQQEVQNLSGGNQQKVVLSRWLATHPKVLILDEPTKGIDVGAKAEVHNLVKEMAAGGLAVMLITSELDEALALSDRLIVMHEGRIRAEVDPARTSREEVMQWAVT